MNNKLNIFVSYGHDKYVTYARKVAEELKIRGHEVWFDEDKLKPGPAWEEYIENGLERVIASGNDGRMLYIMTPHYLRECNINTA